MLQRILLVLAILVGGGSIAVTFTKLREHVTGIVADRDQNKKDLATMTDKFKKTDKSLKETAATLDKTKSDLTDTQSRLTATENRATAAENRSTSLRNDLDKEKTKTSNLQADLAKWDQVVDGVGRRLTPERAVGMIGDLKMALEKNVVLEKENKVLADRGRILEDQLDQIFGQQAEVIMPTGLKGKVVNVDPKWQFVVLDVGSNKGARQRGVFKVHRGEKLIGKVRITSVTPDSCIANVLTDWTVDEIREGDQVLY